MLRNIVPGELAERLRDWTQPVSKVGHTDNIPIQTDRFPSNCKPSTARATMVTRHLIGQGVAADRLREPVGSVYSDSDLTAAVQSG